MNKFFLFFLLIPFFGNAQILFPDSEFLEYYRVLEMKNEKSQKRLGVFPSIVGHYETDAIEWNVWSEYYNPNKRGNRRVSFESVRMTNFYNSNYARGYNDGALWKGKGLTSSFQAGVTGKIGKIEFSFAPIVYFSQNSDFGLAESNSNTHMYNYRFNRTIDFVQRYGEESFVQFNLGQTGLYLVHKGFSIGVSTQNITWGPAQRSPMLLSNNAAGIPHVELGTHTPLKTRIGTLEYKLYWGQLNESNYYDDNEKNNSRFWTGFAFAYNPVFLPGLTLGFNRVFYKKGEEFTNSDLLISFWRFNNRNDTPNRNDEFDQMGSATIRWLFEEVGFEAYLEFGKNDFGGKLILSTEPEHARGYTLGFSKYLDIKESGILKLTYEHTTIDKAKSGLYRGHNSWYAHNVVEQGYTMDGQILGAGIGPGSNTDYFDGQYFYKKGRIQLSAQRIRFNDDYFITNITDKYRHDHEWTVEVGYSRFIHNIMVGMRAGLSFRENMYYELENSKKNVSIGFDISRRIKI